MNFMKSRYYRFNAIFLTIIGQWPYQSSKWHRLHQITIHLDIITVMIVQLIKMFEVWGDVDIMVECFTPVGVQLGACIKSINTMINYHKVKTLLNHVQRDWSSLTNEREKKILSQFAERGRTMTIAYAIFLFGSMAMYLLIPMSPSILDVILPLNETRERRYLYHTQYFVDSNENYYAIAVHTYSGTILTIWTVVAVDTMFAMFVQHACGLLAIIGFAVLIEASYSSSFLFQLGLCMILISASLLQLLTKLGQYDEMYRILQFTTAQLFHLFFNSWPGQKLIDQSASLSKSIYFAGWPNFSSRSSSLIKIIMMSAATPLKITACKFYDMSMENFGMVIQTSISYFTILASLR